MTADYMPTTDEVQNAWAEVARFDMSADAADDAFDRWLAEVRREAAEKAWDEGREAEELSWKHVFDGHPVPDGEMCDECAVVNPYRQKETDRGR